MLTVLSFGMVIMFVTLIMTKRASPLVALIVISSLFALVACYAGDDPGKLMYEGIRLLAPTGVMLMFAILYFGVMIDAGSLDPVVNLTLRIIGNDPMKAVLGTRSGAAELEIKSYADLQSDPVWKQHEGDRGGQRKKFIESVYSAAVP